MSLQSKAGRTSKHGGDFGAGKRFKPGKRSFQRWRSTRGLPVAGLASAHGQVNASRVCFSGGASDRLPWDKQRLWRWSPAEGKNSTSSVGGQQPWAGAPRLGPPVFAVVDHYKVRYGDDRAVFIRAIVDGTKAPRPEKTLKPGAVRRCQSKPALPRLTRICALSVIYPLAAELAESTWYRKHSKAEHGPRT